MRPRSSCMVVVLKSEDDARAAASEFVEFCRGRIWVFSDAGTTGTGERLYAFTHRTFLEYFAGAQLAYDMDSPEQLAHALIPYISHGKSWTVAELALQIKDRTSNMGALRIYAALLNDMSGSSKDLLRFLVLCLRSVDPSPQRVRDLTRRLFEETCQADQTRAFSAASADETEPGVPDSPTTPWASTWGDLLTSCGSYRDTVANEVDAVITGTVRSGNQSLITSSLRLAFSLHRYALLPPPPRSHNNIDWSFWSTRTYSSAMKHRAFVVACAGTDAYLRLASVENHLITVEQALDMPGGPIVLFQESKDLFHEHLSSLGMCSVLSTKDGPHLGSLL